MPIIISDDVVALNKPYGLQMFGDNMFHSVEKYQPMLAKHLNCEELFQVHRIDKVTSGILLLAKTKEMHKYLTELFRTRKIEKSYWTIVNGTPNPKEAVINIPMIEANSNGRFRMTILPDYKNESNLIKTKKLSNITSRTLPAVTNYRTIKSKGNSALLEVKPITGYKHQIRVHLGLGLNNPVLGDHKYSNVFFDGKPQKIHGDILKRLNVRKENSRDLPILLHSKTIKIPGLNNDSDVMIQCKLPFHFVRIMKALNLNPSNITLPK